MKVVLPQFRCLQCGHIWFPRKAQEPLRCGSCKSPYWNRPAEGEFADLMDKLIDHASDSMTQEEFAKAHKKATSVVSSVRARASQRGRD